MKLTGGWDPGIRHLEDWELWIRLATRVGIVSVPHVTGLYRIVRDPSRSANASVVQAEQMVLFEGLISAMLADGRGFHRVLIDCLDAGHWEQAQCAFECLCSSAAAYPIGNLDVIRSQYLALRRGIKAGLSYKEVRMALARLVQRRLVLNLAELHRQVRKSIDRYISWRIRRFL